MKDRSGRPLGALGVLLPALLLLIGPHAPPRVINTVAVGESPFGVAVNPRSGRIYVTNASSDSVSVIDPATNTVAKTITVGRQPFYWIGVNPTTNRIYIVNNRGGSLSVIDGAADVVVATVPGLRGAPEGAGVDEARNRVYVTRRGSELTAVDAATNRLLTTIDTGKHNHGVVVNPITDRAYVSRSSPGAVTVVELAPFSRSHEIAAVGHPAIDPLTNRIYLADFTSPRITVVDGARDAVEAEITLEHTPLLLALNPDTQCLYATHPAEGKVTVVDMQSRTVRGTVAVGRTPSGIAVSRSTNLVYVANSGSGTVSIIEGTVCGVEPTPTTYAPSPTRTVTPTATSPPPTATPTGTATVTSVSPTARHETPNPSVSATPPLPRCVCAEVVGRVPSVVVQDAMANPQRFYGWGLPLDLGKPISPANPMRQCLSLPYPTLGYHPVWNRPQWRVGCR